jgi:hypothetical protein
MRTSISCPAPLSLPPHGSSRKRPQPLPSIPIRHHAPQARPDPNSPANIDRTQLTNYLDDIAAKETAARRATIAPRYLNLKHRTADVKRSS